MDFRLELQVKPFTPPINIRQPLLLAGSCFTEHMARRFRDFRFQVLENPNGIVFNPFSIQQSVASWIVRREYTSKDIFYHNDLWQSWDFHGSFADVDAAACLQKMNAQTAEAHAFLRKTNWLIITLGSAFVYELANNSMGGQMHQVTANCHKVAANHFRHRMASLPEVETCLQTMIDQVKLFNPACRIVFTISPVRHYREGLVENNRSKGVLHNAVFSMLQQFDHVHYFPSYELVIDDLRDYRFYAEDLVHPNYAATQYVWEKFEEAAIDAESRNIIVKLQDLLRAFRHKPFNPSSNGHLKFLQAYQKKSAQARADYPYLNLEDIVQFFEHGVANHSSLANASR